MDYQKLFDLTYVDQIYQHFWDNQMDNKFLIELIQNFTILICKVLSNKIQNDSKYQIVKYNIAVWATYHQKYNESNKMIQNLLTENLDIILKIKLFLLMCRNCQHLNELVDVEQFKHTIIQSLEIHKEHLTEKKLKNINIDMKNLMLI